MDASGPSSSILLIRSTNRRLSLWCSVSINCSRSRLPCIHGSEPCLVFKLLWHLQSPAYHNPCSRGTRGTCRHFDNCQSQRPHIYGLMKRKLYYDFWHPLAEGLHAGRRLNSKVSQCVCVCVCVRERERASSRSVAFLMSLVFRAVKAVTRCDSLLKWSAILAMNQIKKNKKT